jgi:hypothetical protein
MTITYLQPTIEEGKTSTEVTFVNSAGEHYIRRINVPRTSDGTVDQVALTDTLESQLMGVINKEKIGLITFTTGSINSGSVV